MIKGRRLLLAMACIMMPRHTWSSCRPTSQSACTCASPASPAVSPRSVLQLRGGSADPTQIRPDPNDPGDPGAFFLEFDQQLQDEILNDIKRNDKDQLPLFIERLGEEEQTGAFKYGVGVEAAMPPVIGDAADAEMEDEDGAAAPAGSARIEAVAAETCEQREAAELREAQAWFAEQDKKYYHWSEFVDNEPIIGHTGIPQKRELTIGDPLETYLELRKESAELSRFMRSLPRNRTQIAQVLDDVGWHEGILRNGTRIKWEPGLRVIDMDSMSEQESSDDVFDEDLGHRSTKVNDNLDFEVQDGAWFRDTIHALAQEAWNVTSPADTDYSEFFKQRNATFNELASMNAFLNDTFILSCDDWVKKAAGNDQHRLRAREHLWRHYDVKWQEFVNDDRRAPPAPLAQHARCRPAVPHVARYPCCRTGVASPAGRLSTRLLSGVHPCVRACTS